MSIPFIDLKTQYRELKPLIHTRIDAVLEHGQYIMGPEVHELEERLTVYTGAKYCITVASGTEALLISLMALGIGQGDEIITTPFTFAATAEVIVLLGAKPVFVDIEPGTCNINAALIESAITANTKAIIPVSLYGQPADIDEINSIGAKYGRIPVIEDAAQSFGSIYKGSRSCNVSTIGCTSFFPSKPLGCYGDGGAIFTSDDTIAQACREIRIHGQSTRYHHNRVGVGGRMDTLQCAVLLAKLERFDWEIDRRKQLGARYHELIHAAKLEQVELLHVKPDRDCVWAQYTVKVQDRDDVQRRLAEKGIPTAIHYPIPLHRQPAYARFAEGQNFPASDGQAARVMSLPMSADLHHLEQDRIVQALQLAVMA